MRNLILFVICVLFIFQGGCCSSFGKGAWNDNISGFWSWRSGETTAPESATFANQGLYLGQQSGYISPPSSATVVDKPATAITPSPNATPAPNPVFPATINSTPPPSANSIPTPIPDPIPTPIPTPTPNYPPTSIPAATQFPAYDPFTTTSPNTVPATPTLTNVPENYFAATNAPQKNNSEQLQNSTAPKPTIALSESYFANNYETGSIGSTESKFAPTHYDTDQTNAQTNLTANNNRKNKNIPLTTYEIAAAGTAETAFQNMETRTGTQIKTSQNGITTITTSTTSPVTSSSHFITEIKTE
ncbi:MAG: hypothetical protein LBP59_19155 [Planctomycetaceae bacterium]|jgi:hypothetical protein|nr:hypothetical protein [Planctomycetaceae bacterium]